MTLRLNTQETCTESLFTTSVQITGRIFQFVACMIEVVNDKLIEQFSQNFSNMLVQENRETNSDSISAES